jgi:hypothetical protein
LTSPKSESVRNVWLQDLHFTDIHLSFGLLGLMSGYHSYWMSGYPREFYSTDPAIGHDVPKPYISILDRQQPEGSEILADFLANKGTAFSKAHLKLKVKGKGEDKGKGKGEGEGKGKGKFSLFFEANKASGRRRSRSRSPRCFES